MSVRSWLVASFVDPAKGVGPAWSGHRRSVVAVPFWSKWASGQRETTGDGSSVARPPRPQRSMSASRGPCFQRPTEDAAWSDALSRRRYGRRHGFDIDGGQERRSIGLRRGGVFNSERGLRPTHGRRRDEGAQSRRDERLHLVVGGLERGGDPATRNRPPIAGLPPGRLRTSLFPAEHTSFSTPARPLFDRCQVGVGSGSA